MFRNLHSFNLILLFLIILVLKNSVPVDMYVTWYTKSLFKKGFFSIFYNFLSMAFHFPGVDHLFNLQAHTWAAFLEFLYLLSPSKSLVNLQSFSKTWLFFTTSKSFNFSCLGLPKVQLPFICLCNSNAYAPQAIRSYIDCLLQTEYK